MGDGLEWDLRCLFLRTGSDFLNDDPGLDRVFESICPLGSDCQSSERPVSRLSRHQRRVAIESIAPGLGLQITARARTTSQGHYPKSRIRWCVHCREYRTRTDTPGRAHEKYPARSGIDDRGGRCGSLYVSFDSVYNMK